VTHIIITAGGTSEPIDGVRRISNTSTGRLCACIYEALSDHIGAHAAQPGRRDDKEPGYTVHYVVSATAVRPEPRENLPVFFYPVSDVESVLSALKELTEKYEIAYVIHAMAVSDFTRGYLIEREVLVGELAAAVERALAEGRERRTDAVRNSIAQVMAHPAGALAPQAKASSRSELILSLVKTPKVIDRIRQWAPSAFLVGFKLLHGVPEETLVQVADALAEASGCNLVLANDASRIGADGHFGLLVKEGAVAGRFETRREIADGIVRHMLGGYSGSGERSTV